MSLKDQKIFCIGLPRTGTTSLDLAFKELEIPAIHFPFEMWENDDFSALGAYQAFSDTPVFAIYQELDRRCPGSKFILTTRPVEEWLKSMQWLRKNSGKLWQRPPAVDRFNKEFFGAEEYDRDLYSAAYQKHLDAVHSYFSGREDDLLILELAQEADNRRLLEFLGIDNRSARAWPRANPARSPNWLQSIAFRLERKKLTRFGTYVRRFDAKLRR